MKYLLILLILFSACDAGLTEDDVLRVIEEATAEPEVEAVEPGFIPERMHVYILAADDEIIYDIEATSEAHYSQLLSAVKATAEIHNRDYPDDYWRWMGGGL